MNLLGSSGSPSDPARHAAPLPSLGAVHLTDSALHLADGTLSAVYLVQGHEYDLSTLEDVALYTEGLKRVLNSLAPGMRLRVLHRIRNTPGEFVEQVHSSLDGENAFARYALWDYFRRLQEMATSRHLLFDETLFVLSYRPMLRNGSRGARSPVPPVSPNAVLSEEQYLSMTQAREEFEELLSPVLAAMSQAGLAPTRMQGKDLDDLVRSELSISPQSPALVVPKWSRGRGVAEVNGRFYGHISMRSFPQHVYPSMSLILATLPFEATVAVDAVMVQSHKELERQRREAESFSSPPTFHSWTSSPPALLKQPLEGFTAVREGDEVQYPQSPENPLLVSFGVTVSGSSAQEVSERCALVEASFRNMEGAVGSRTMDPENLMQQIASGWSLGEMFDPERKLLTSAAACLLPVYSRVTGPKQGSMLLMDRMARLVRHAPFPQGDAPANRIVCGSCGTGKSFVVQLMDLFPHLASRGSEVIVVDSGGSFDMTVCTLGGQSIQPGPRSSFMYSPFTLPDNFDELRGDRQEEELRYKYDFLVQLFLCMARLEDPEEVDIAEVVLRRVVERLFQTHRFPRMRDLHRLLVEYPSEQEPRVAAFASCLAERFEPYTETEKGVGPYARYFDTDSNSHLEGPALNFDLIQVKNDDAAYYPLILTILGAAVYNRLARADGIQRLYVLDEAWGLVRALHGDEEKPTPSCRIIMRLWEEGQKHGGRGIFITQSYGDLQESPLLQNPEVKVGGYFLSHEHHSCNDRSFQKAGWSDAKMEAVYMLRTLYGTYAELLVEHGPDAERVVRLPNNPLLYWMATTAPQDLQVRRRYMKRYHEERGLDVRAVLAILAEDYPNGSHGPSSSAMSEAEAVLFAREWMERFHRFSEKVERGLPIPLDFS